MHAASPPLDESLPRLSAIRGARPLIRKSICSPADKLFRPEPNRSLPWRSVARNVNGIGAKADSIQNQNSTSTDYRLIVVGCCSKFFFFPFDDNVARSESVSLKIECVPWPG